MAITITRGPKPNKKPKAPQIKPHQVPAAMVHQGPCAKAEQIAKFKEAMAKRRKATTGGGADGE